MAIIQIRDVYKIYNQSKIPVHAVNGITLDFEKGDFAAIVGPSGCGKTTLLNLLSGLDKPTSGSVMIAGKEITHLKSHEQIEFRLHHIGFVFQTYNLIPVLTALENVAFIMELQGVTKKERTEKARKLLDRVGLMDKLNDRPALLSGGQQQRVAVARALASNPDFIIADEPTANLDSKATAELLEIMREMNRELNVTFIFATHDQRVVDKATRVIRIEDGKLTADIRQEPKGERIKDKG